VKIPACDCRNNDRAATIPRTRFPCPPATNPPDDRNRFRWNAAKLTNAKRISLQNRCWLRDNNRSSCFSNEPSTYRFELSLVMKLTSHSLPFQGGPSPWLFFSGDKYISRPSLQLRSVERLFLARVRNTVPCGFAPGEGRGPFVHFRNHAGFIKAFGGAKRNFVRRFSYSHSRFTIFSAIRERSSFNFQ